MNIIQAYKIRKAIVNYQDRPNLEVQYNRETYRLETEKYDIIAEKKLGLSIVKHPVCERHYNVQPQTRYVVTASDNKSDNKITDSGFWAQLLFKQMNKKYNGYTNLNIIQAYKLYTDIKASKNNPYFQLSAKSEHYTLETEHYEMTVEEKSPANEEDGSWYTFSAKRKNSDEIISTDGFVAYVLFAQIRNKIKQH